MDQPLPARLAAEALGTFLFFFMGFSGIAVVVETGAGAIGPFGVAESERGRGIGAVLLFRTLEIMRRKGHHNAWFLWTGLEEPAGYLYTRVGFHVSRQFAVMRASASAPEGR